MMGFASLYPSYILKTLLNERLAQALRGDLEQGGITDIARLELHGASTQ
ncbi:MAG: hypothetical protein FWD77_06945 [Betaproteobacteria bacterium]|nr:hypothetical protein [Betaproteobacteria bacterium]